MIDPRAGFIYNSNNVPVGGKVNGIDFRAGFAVVTERILLGVLVDHLTQPNESLHKGKSPLPMHFGVQASYQIPLKKYGKFRLTPFFRFDGQSDERVFQVGSMFYRNNYHVGLAWRDHDSFNLMAGYNSNYFSFRAGYDISIGDLSGITGGSWEASIGLKIGSFRHRGPPLSSSPFTE